VRAQDSSKSWSTSHVAIEMNSVLLETSDAIFHNALQKLGEVEFRDDNNGHLMCSGQIKA